MEISGEMSGSNPTVRTGYAVYRGGSTVLAIKKPHVGEEKDRKPWKTMRGNGCKSRQDSLVIKKGKLKL